MNHDLIKYLDNIDYNDFDIKHKYFDLILAGGGFKGYYHLGLFKILKHHEKQNKIKIRHIVGTSTGAISAVIYACDLDFNRWINTFYKIKENIHKSDLHQTVINILKDELPENAYQICTNKIKISTSKLTIFGFVEIMFDKFESNEHLLQVLSGSIKIPYLTSKSLFGEKINNNYYYDGFFTRLCPIIFNNNIPQLFIKTYASNYSNSLSLKPVDSHIELLSLRGLYESKKFFKHDKQTKIIKWIEPNNEYKKSFYQKYICIIIPSLFFVFSLKK